jgi:hypothetical protein
MQVEDKEINGFLIDEFNQHGLEVGKTQGICPLCSHTRKPKNRKLKCASYDWERGLGTCHNCNSTFQLHTYERKGASEREYVRPVFSTCILEWYVLVYRFSWLNSLSLTLRFLIRYCIRKLTISPNHLNIT